MKVNVITIDEATSGWIAVSSNGWLKIEITRPDTPEQNQIAFEKAALFNLIKTGTNQFALQLLEKGTYYQYFTYAVLTDAWPQSSGGCGIGYFRGENYALACSPNAKPEDATNWRFVGTEDYLVCLDSTKVPGKTKMQIVSMDPKDNYIYASSLSTLKKFRFLVEQIDDRRRRIIGSHQRVRDWLGYEEAIVPELHLRKKEEKEKEEEEVKHENVEVHDSMFIHELFQ